jgi:diguanylate cyclase (GGDEF)-like protein
MQPIERGTTGAGAARPLVLVVDDDPVMNLYAREQLIAAGYAAETIENGLQVVGAIREHHPDLVILDVQMPGIDGFDTCRLIRSSEEGRHTPVLMLTALDDLESIELAYEAGATDFANKPANWTLLAHRLEYMLRSSRSASDLRASRARLANAQRIAKLGHWEWDVEADELIVSSQMREILGMPEDARLAGIRSLLAHVHLNDRNVVRDALEQTLADGESRDLEYRLRRANREDCFVRQRAEVAMESGRSGQLVTGVVLDITDQQRAENRARFLSRYDGLTELPNRRSFREHLDAALLGAVRHGRHLAIMLIDLDRFNRINETLGREAGDLALREQARRLASHLRGSDSLSRPEGDVLARLSGDEFALLLTDLASPSDAAKVAERLGGLISQPLAIGGTQVVLTASVGISVFPEDGGDSETLLANAEAALFSLRRRGGGNYQFYSAEMNENATERLALETELTAAVRQGELRLEYQPLYDTASTKLKGAEALVRWQHPERGRVSPASFIPLAERTGAIISIGEWVLRTACRQAKIWQDDGRGALSISVNVSARQLERADFPETVERILASTGLDPKLLNLEITESFLLEDVDRAALSLESLKALGVRLSLDDFGTGYSSLSHLIRLPLDTIKIDRSFLKGIPGEASCRSITKAIIAMAQGVGMEVVAEGVETEQQIEFLRLQGCDTLQGYLLGHPLPATEFDLLPRRFDLDRSASSAA